VCAVFSQPICAKEERNCQFYVTSANEGHSTTEPRHGNDFFTLWHFPLYHPFYSCSHRTLLPPIPPFLLMLTRNLTSPYSTLSTHAHTEPYFPLFHPFCSCSHGTSLPPIPPFLLMLTQNLSPKDMPKVTYHNVKVACHFVDSFIH